MNHDDVWMCVYVDIIVWNFEWSDRVKFLKSHLFTGKTVQNFCVFVFVKITRSKFLEYLKCLTIRNWEQRVISRKASTYVGIPCHTLEEPFKWSEYSRNLYRFSRDIMRPSFLVSFRITLVNLADTTAWFKMLTLYCEILWLQEMDSRACMVQVHSYRLAETEIIKKLYQRVFRFIWILHIFIVRETLLL